MIELKAYNLKEFFAADFGEQSNRIGIAEFSPATQEIKLHVYQNSHTYDIDLNRGLSLENWLRHLNRKNWATSETLGDFARLWLQVNV